MAIQSTGTNPPSTPHVRLPLFMYRIQFSRARRSAARAQKAFSQSGSGPDSTSKDTTARTEKMIKTVKRRRKQRFRRLREMIQSSNDDSQNLNGREGGFVCPVCLERLFGDPDVTEAHVDACLVHAMPSAYEETEIDIGGPTRTRVTDGANLTGLFPQKIDDRSTIEPLNLQLWVSTSETQTTKMSKRKSTSMGTTMKFSVKRNSQRWTSCLRRGQ